MEKFKCECCGEMFQERQINRCIFLGLEIIMCKKCFSKDLKESN
jgi:hypothetical protein